ncbi:hypothetical protein [Pseudonocardia cypriaca]|uniref:Uncharacterized protein n=1 Tax=Pseudonocardia cypriaca TaxID=882449 RepID=A0A543FZC9_9PSEU|nr:hypothetical protein [Pseudonocardia cypriaca]TQM39177.1 hypothetical protein FB388_6433 [Pseudonocardia cypriaca]
MSYPIVETRTFTETVRADVTLLGIRTPFRGRRMRRREEIPEVPSGHVAVVRLPEEYTLFERALDPEDETLLRALSVTVIDIRDFPGEVRVHLSGRTGADKFTVLIAFTCRVSDPETVAQRGGRGVEAFLTNYFRGNPELQNLASDYDSGQMGVLRRIISAEVRAFAQMIPIEIPGVEVSIGAIEVLTPGELETHDIALRDQERRHELRSKETAFQRSEARSMHEFIDGDPAYVARRIALLGVQHGAVTMTDVIEIQHKLADEARESLRAQQDLRVQFATALVQRGFFDRTSDALQLVEQLWDAESPKPISDRPPPIRTESEVPASGARSIAQDPNSNSTADPGFDDSDYEDLS